MLPEADTYEALCERFHWNIPPALNLGVEVCDRWAATDPDKPAIIDLTGEARANITYGALKHMSDALAAHLQAQGVLPGDRVGVFRTQSAWSAAAHIAIWKLGAISIPLFTLFGEDALEVRLSNSQTKLVITDPGHRDRFRNTAIATVVPEEGLPDSDFTPADTNAEDPAVLIYTSGSTGAPKGALHAHRVLLGHIPGVEMSHNGSFQPGDVLWTPADWAWIGGLF